MTETSETFTPASRRFWFGELVLDFLQNTGGLDPHVADLLHSVARVESTDAGQVVAYGAEWIHIVVKGVVKEETPHGTSRLWRTGAILGNLDMVMSRNARLVGSGSRLTFLTQGVLLSVTARTLGVMVQDEPSLAMFLLKLTHQRSSTVETVYASSKADPVVKVARLMEYLVLPGDARRSKHARMRWTRNGPVEIPEGAVTVFGPTQNDMADVLGLGRTTVEKVIASLRANGTLSALVPGARTNRYYEIINFYRLRRAARAGT